MNFHASKITDSPLLKDNWRDNYKRLRYLADSLGVEFVQSHAQGGNPLKRDENFDILVEVMNRTFEACSILGIKNTTLKNLYINIFLYRK
jgi:hypothetical protein